MKNRLAGTVLLVVGLALLGQNLGLFGAEWIRTFWPLILVGVGLWMLLGRRR